MRVNFSVVLWCAIGTAAVGAAGCAAGDDAAGAGETSGVTGTTQFLVWEPGTTLVTEHSRWHSPCGGSGARKCSNQGEDFLIFHRNFLNRLRNEYQRQGLTADVSPWYQLPPEMKNPRYWSAEHQKGENAIWTMIDPTTGQRFVSLDRFGVYLEGYYHGHLHGIAAAVYGESVVGSAGTSPRSTYFFKIHGLVDWHLSRFQHGNFDKNGQSDHIAYTPSTRAVDVWLMQGTSRISINRIGTQTAGCGWYVGATGDFNYDGQTDIIWHSRDCARTVAWMMNGLTRASTVEMNGVDSSWTLVGSRDFNRDSRPDLVWINGQGGTALWYMNGTAIAGSQGLQAPAGYYPVVPGDFDGNGTGDLLVRRYNDGYDYFIQHNGTGTPMPVTDLSRSPYSFPVAVAYYAGFDDGRLFGQLRRQVDLVFETFSPGSPNPTYGIEYSTSATTGGGAAYENQTPRSVPIGQVLSGPR